MLEIRTERLRLMPLTLKQLGLYLDRPQELQKELGFPVSRDVLTERVQRALSLKLEKMPQADEATHVWHTYWLIVVAADAYGAGLAGFEGPPDNTGEVEIGYGMDPAYQSRGYMTEAVHALLDWAFQNPGCKSVVARDTKKSNLASLHVLAKMGMTVYEEVGDALNLRVDREEFWRVVGRR
ncbi:MAG TPA: GNAT family N-acetyltransferase [Anaerolineales bacterium]|nr:GNAT family N-acetyltransferase [Anaerolineales bacterium]